MVVVGDVHGEFKTLLKLLGEFLSEQICLVGDLIDRGRDSVRVVDYLIENSDRVSCVAGNHERLLLDYVDFGEVAWLLNGGEEVLEQYSKRGGVNKFDEHVNFIRALPSYLEWPELKDATGRHLRLSHSVAIDQDLEKCVRNESLFWGRRIPPRDPSAGRRFNVFGHSIVPEPVVTEWYANIDSGFFTGRPLTALIWPEMRIVQVSRV